MTSERTTYRIGRTTKRFVELSNSNNRVHAEYDLHTDNETKVFSRVEKAHRMAALQVVAVPENLRSHEVSLHIHLNLP